MKNLIIIISLFCFFSNAFGQKISRTPINTHPHNTHPQKTINKGAIEKPKDEEKIFGICKSKTVASYDLYPCETIEITFASLPNTGSNKIVRIHWKKSNSSQWSRQTFNNVGSTPQTYSIPGIPGQKYDIYVEAKRLACPSYEGIESANQIMVQPCNTSSFTINGSTGSQIDICGEEPILLDGSGSAHETAYEVYLQEVNASNNPIGGQVSRYYVGQVPSNFDVRSFAQQKNFPMIGGKRYKITLETRDKPVFSSKILNFLPATVNFSPNAGLKSGSTDKYDKCGSLALTLNTSGSSCTSRYFVEIAETDQWNNEVAGTKFSAWITPLTPLPNSLDITQIYTSQGFNFRYGKTYRIKLAVGFPWADKTIWVSFHAPGTCPLDF